ncbi:MFS sugar transporter [Lecanosticta acicola]|uniref:MFS sugar transporter n=1 Tax=Lecanosticta acicola TaxID=111012 RepID=A0AAI8Z9I9_9PEZI|nr:MFS sugar transporter [Lecanosticta acicola]
MAVHIKSGAEFNEKKDSSSPSGSERRDVFDVPGEDNQKLSAVFENPLAGVSRDDLMQDVTEFCQQYDLMKHLEVMKKGALVAHRPFAAQDIDELSAEEKAQISRELTHKWDQPWMLYFLVTMSSLAAAVQGMDESVNNGAQAFYLKELNVSPSDRFSPSMQSNLTGLIVGAPYLACAVLGCWLTEPLNRLFARRGTIFISCFVAAVASVWEGVSNSWVNLFIARFVLGLGIGSKSSTVPVYAAECAPAPIRGALVMQWQVWTAFGIMLGNVMGVAFGGLRPDLAWRLILGSTVVLPVLVCAMIYFCPESPRWLIQHGKMKEAFRGFRQLRRSDIQAARDLYYTHVGVALETKVNEGKNFFTMFRELFSVPRNRRATWATWIVMFGQQFCGVNVIAYYSTTIFEQGGYGRSNALLVSMGTGILNWLFALPAFFTIDTLGRRNLLLVTYPFLCITLLWTGLSFLIDESKTVTRTAMITTGMYLFECFYSPGMGPVPFLYSAEAFPMNVRDVGMSWGTATTWCFNFILSFTWPSLVSTFQPEGAFGWYAAWCMILWVLVLLFMPETKALTLEELDQVFSVPTWKHSRYQLRNAKWHFSRWVLRKKEEPLKPLYEGQEKLMKYQTGSGEDRDFMEAV